MKAAVGPLVVLVVLTWPSAAQQQECEAADTVVGAREQATVTNLTGKGEEHLDAHIWLKPEPGFEGFIVNISTGTSTNVLWFPIYTHCFPPITDWWEVRVLHQYTYREYHMYRMYAGKCHWYCDNLPYAGQLLSSQVVAVGPSRWRGTPPSTCTTRAILGLPPHTHKSCSPLSRNLTTNITTTTTTTTTASECEAADTVVGAGEEETVITIIPREGEENVVKYTWLRPEPGFQGIILNVSTIIGTSAVWFPTYAHCFVPGTDWWRVRVVCQFMNRDTHHYGVDAGECNWYCLNQQYIGQFLSVQVVAVGPSRCRGTPPPYTCITNMGTYYPPHRHESCRPPNISFTATITASITTTTASTTTTTTTTFTSATLLLVVCAVAIVAATLVGMKIRHCRTAAAPGAAASSHSHTVTQTSTAEPGTLQGQGEHLDFTPLPPTESGTPQGQGEHLEITPLPQAEPGTAQDEGHNFNITPLPQAEP